MQEVDTKNELTLSGPILQDLQDIITTATIDDDLSEPKHAAPTSTQRQQTMPLLPRYSQQTNACL